MSGVENGLKQKTIHGVEWSALDNAIKWGVSFVVGIILARLLSPDDYGLIGIIGIFTAVCDALINGGFYAALIRKKEATEDDFSTVFFLNLGISILLYIIVFFCAPLIARFFERHELVVLTRVSTISLIVGALSLVQQVRLTKRIDFKTQTKITLFASTVSGVLGIAMAFSGFGVWSLVAQSLSSQVIKTVLLWLHNKWIPHRHFSKQSFRDLFGFGWKLMMSRLLDTVWKELNQVVVGKFYTSAALGQYTRANSFAQLLSSNLTDVVQRVSFPVLSSIQDDSSRMIAAYRHIIKLTMFVSSVGMFALGAISEPLLYCLIGPKWNEAAIYLPIICINMSLYPLHAINLNMLQVQGRSDLFLGLEIVKKILSLGPLFIGAFIGIIPMLYANIIMGIISFFLNSYWSGKLLGYYSWMQIIDIAPNYGIAFLVALSVWFLKYLPLSYWIILPMQVILGVCVFVVLCKFAGVHEYNEVLQMIKPILNRFNFKPNDKR